jgi:hypothetical protein
MEALLKSDCPNCGGGIEYQSDFAGADISCPHCNQAFALPPAPPVLTPTPRNKRMGVCFDCNREVSRRADVCPHCGAPMKAKKGVFYYVFVGTVSLIVTLIVLGLLLAFGGAILAGLSAR